MLSFLFTIVITVIQLYLLWVVGVFIYILFAETGSKADREETKARRDSKQADFLLSID